MSHPYPPRQLVSALLAALAVAASGPAAAGPYEDALQRFDKGDLTGAIVQLKTALQKEPKMLAAHLLLGKALLRTGSIKAAEAEFEEALRLGVNRGEVAVPLGRAYLIMGETKKLVETISPNDLPKLTQAEVYTLRGTAFAMMGNRLQAAQSFDLGKQADPEGYGAYVGDALLKMRNGDPTGALAAATKATELAPKNAASWDALGRVQRSLGDNKGALASFDKALAIDPANIDVRIARSGLHLSEGRDADAVKDLDFLKQGGIVDPRATYVRAVIAARKGDAKAARDGYNDVVNQVTKLFPGIFSGDEATLMAAALSQNAVGNNEKAREYLKALLVLAPKHYAGQLMLATLSIEAKEWATAQAVLDPLYRDAPEDPAVLSALGSLNLGRKNYQQATEFFEKALTKGPSPQALRDLGLSQYGLGNDKRGTELLEQALAKNPNDIDLMMRLAMVYGSQGNNAKAQQVAESALKIEPTNPMVLSFVGNIRGRAGDKKGARDAFETLLKKDPKFMPAIINLTWLDIEEGKFDAGRARLVQQLKAAGRDPDLLFQRGALEFRAGKEADASNFWEQSMEVRPNDPRPGMALLDLYRRQGDLTRALTVAKTLAAQNASNAPALLAVAETHLAAGDAPRARAIYRDVVRLVQNDPDKLVTVGRMQLAAGSAEDAIYTQQKALQLRPNDMGAMALQVEIDFRSGNRAKADASLKALNAKYPGELMTLLTNGHAAVGAGQFAAAAQHYQAAFKKQPSTAHAVLWAQAQLAAGNASAAVAQLADWSKKQPDDRGALVALADTQTRAGLINDAKASYARLVQLDANAPSAWVAYAQALMRAKDPLARSTAEKALKLAPTSAEALATLGWIQVEEGQTDAGISNLRDARLRAPNVPELRLQLALALAKGGRRTEAGEELKAAIGLQPQLGDRPDVKAMRRDLGV